MIFALRWWQFPSELKVTFVCSKHKCFKVLKRERLGGGGPLPVPHAGLLLINPTDCACSQIP